MKLVEHHHQQMEIDFACNVAGHNTSLMCCILPYLVLEKLYKQKTEVPKSCLHNLYTCLDHPSKHFECAKKKVHAALADHIYLSCKLSTTNSYSTISKGYYFCPYIIFPRTGHCNKCVITIKNSHATFFKNAQKIVNL